MHNIVEPRRVLLSLPSRLLFKKVANDFYSSYCLKLPNYSKYFYKKEERKNIGSSSAAVTIRNAFPLLHFSHLQWRKSTAFNKAVFPLEALLQPLTFHSLHGVYIYLFCFLTDLTTGVSLALHCLKTLGFAGHFPYFEGAENNRTGKPDMSSPIGQEVFMCSLFISIYRCNITYGV